MHLPLTLLFAIAAGLAGTSATAQGLRIDVHAGLDSLHSDGESAEGATYGLTIGYDAVRGPAVLGVQLDLDASDNTRCESDLFVPGDRACVEAGRDTAVSVRAGSFVTPSTLLYAVAGYANARFDARYRAAGIGESDRETLEGVRLGAGLTTAFGSRLYGKVEYRYTNYEEGVTRHQGVAGLGVRF